MAEPRDMVEAVKTAAEIGRRRGGIDLSEWESEFVESIEDQLNDQRSLSEKQMVILEKLYDRT